MKQSKSFLIAIIMVTIFSNPTYAQIPDWLEGKWLADVIYEIEDSTIMYSQYGVGVKLGKFTINENSVIVVDGQESELIILNDEQVLAYKTNPNFKIPKYENITLPEKYKWVIGSWTDGEYITTFTEKNVTIKQGEYVVNSGIYYLDDDGFFKIYWDKNNEEYFIINGNAIAYEGGDNLIRLSDQQKQTEQSEVFSDSISSLNTSSKPYEGDIKWLYGIWIGDKTEIYITPRYYQSRRENDAYLAGKDLFDLEKTKYVVTEVDNPILGKVIRLDEFYLDPTAKLLYTYSGTDRRSYMERKSKYVSPIISYGKWALLGLLALAAFIALTIIVVRFVKKMDKKAKEKVAMRTLAKQKRARLSKEKAAFKLMTSQISKRVDKIPQKAPQLNSGTSLGIRNVVIISLLTLLLLDFRFGIILLLMTVVPLVIMLINKDLGTSILNYISDLIRKLNDNPEWLLILIGLLMFWEFNAVLGIVITIMGLFYIFTRKDSIRRQRFYSTFKEIIDEAKANHSYIIFWGIVLTTFFILNLFFEGIIFYFAIAILIVFIVNFYYPSAFDKAKKVITESYKKVPRNAFYKKLEKILQSKAKYAVYALIGIIVIFNTHRASVVNTIPLLFEKGGTEIGINSPEANHDTPAKEENSNKSDVESAREEMRELNKQKNILTVKLVGTFDPLEREEIIATMEMIDARAEELSNYLIQKTGFPF